MLLAGDLNTKVFKTRSPPNGMSDPQIDRLFLFLDDSSSMLGKSLSIAHDALTSIDDRVDRTPTSVHFIGQALHLKFCFEDNPAVHDVIPEWKGTSRATQLWEYIFKTLLGNKRPLGAEKDEAIIITDGYDNWSSGAFSGIQGFNHMMNQLVANGVSLRISVLCIGSEDMCKVSNYHDLARATGGVYSHVDPVEPKEDQNTHIAVFVTRNCSLWRWLYNGYNDPMETSKRSSFGSYKEISKYSSESVKGVDLYNIN